MVFKKPYLGKTLKQRSLTHRVFCNDLVEQWPWRRLQGQRSRSSNYVVLALFKQFYVCLNFNQPTNQPTNQHTNQPTNQSINQSINHDHDQSTNNDHDQSINHVSVSCVSYRVQPTNQPTNQSINQSIMIMINQSCFRLMCLI